MMSTSKLSAALCPCGACWAWLYVEAAERAYEEAVKKYVAAREAYAAHLADVTRDPA